MLVKIHGAAILVFLSLLIVAESVGAAKIIAIREQIIKESIKVYTPGESIPFDTIPQMHNDEYFFDAYDELVEMLNGGRPYDLKRAEFLVEWAYYSGGIDYNAFCDSVTNAVNTLKTFIQMKEIGQYKTAANAALFEYFTKPCWMNNNRAFTYDVVDCGGEKDLSKVFVSKVIRIHSGQCFSLPVYYKILCNELGGKASLATAPGHMYIKHVGEDGRWVNVELTTGSFARDEWYIQSMGVSTEAIKNGVFLTAMSDQEDIAYMLYMLGVAYLRKYKEYDYFTLLCANRILEVLPHNCYALELVVGTRQQWGYDYVHIIGDIPSDFIMENYDGQYGAQMLLNTIGYTRITGEEYIRRVEKAYKEIGKDVPDSWKEFRKQINRVEGCTK